MDDDPTRLGNAANAALDDLLDEVAALADEFRRAGHRLYLVGGVVRDLLVEPAAAGATAGSQLIDVDMTTDARPAEVKALVAGWADAVWLQGERFGTIGCKRGDRAYEITTHRAEAYVADSRKPVVEYSTEVEADLSRRDFTVNAMAIDVSDRSFVDPFDGRVDLAAGRLRTPLAPQVSFSDDPLRMLRAARFHARYDLAPDPELVTAIASVRDRLTIVSAERIRDELLKLLAVPDPTPGLRFLDETGLLAWVVPELAVAPSRDAAVAGIATLSMWSRLQRLAALLDGLDASTAGARLRALRLSSADARHIQGQLGAVRFIREVGPSPGAADVRRLAHQLGGALDEPLHLAAALGIEVEGYRSVAAALSAAEDLGDIRAPLDGGQVMAHLGIDGGREVGEALSALLEHRVERGPITESEAYDVLDDWWRAHR